jgi:hypothetical protein
MNGKQSSDNPWLFKMKQNVPSENDKSLKFRPTGATD